MKNRSLEKRNIPVSTACAILLTIGLAASCRPETQQAECPPLPEPKPVMEITPLRIPRNPADDFCNACIRSEAGYVSCQREYEQQKGEDRELLKKRATLKACIDAGYPQDKCPEHALLGIQCKGDQANPGGLSAGEALQVISGGKRDKPDPSSSPSSDPLEKPQTP